MKIGDILWTYMGDPATQPPLPEFEFVPGPAGADVHVEAVAGVATGCRRSRAASTRATSRGCTPAGSKSDPLFKGAKGNEYNLNDMRPFFEVADADGGLFVGARRNAEEGKYYWRITPWVMPSFTMVPPRGDHPVHGHFWVPIDDENCWVYTFDYHPARALTATELQAMKDGHGVHSENIPGTYRPLANKDNDYLMDREAQRRGETFSGVEGIAHAGRVAAGEHGPDRRPHQGAAGLRRTAGSSRPARSCGRRSMALRDEGVDAAGRRPRAPPRPLGGGRAAAGASRSSTPRRDARQACVPACPQTSV